MAFWACGRRRGQYQLNANTWKNADDLAAQQKDGGTYDDGKNPRASPP
jgi:hypothetical protein